MKQPREVPQQLLQLQIEKAIYGGAGLARHDGKAIFIPYTLPGETVAAAITHNKSSFAEAALEDVLEPSPDRVEPPCPYFGSCGGCHYQHANYPAQLGIKAAILEETLTRARLAPLPAIVSHASQPFGYRNRIRLQLDPFAKDEHAVLSYRARGSHAIIGVDRCPIAAPALEQALRSLAALCVEQECAGYFSQVELSANHNGSEVLLALWLRERANPDEAAARLKQLCEALERRLPALRGAGVHAAPAANEPSRGTSRLPRQKRTGQALERQLDEAAGDSSPVATWGVPRVTYRVGTLDYRVCLGSFFQVNHTLLETLVELATGGRGGALAWDLYAGVGLFSRVLAQLFSQVVAVEGAPISAENLRFHLTAPHRAIRSGTVEFLRRAKAEAGRQRQTLRPDFVLVDPPRAGLGEEVTRLLAQIGPPEITYVSCDPATLSRDLRALLDSGYKIQQLHLIDLFPQTFHLETVATLSRR